VTDDAGGRLRLSEIDRALADSQLDPILSALPSDEGGAATTDHTAARLRDELAKARDVIEALLVSETQLKGRCEKSSANVAKFKVLAKDLESQGTINKEALEKAGAIIRKLNEDLAAALDAAAKIWEHNQELQEDL
jgi:hypothetical protein